MVTRTLPFTVLALAAAAASAVPASASTLTLLAPFGAFQARPACAPVTAAPGSLGRGQSKASAILGGGMSQLERIAAQQAATTALSATPPASAGTATAIGWRPEPAAGGLSCTGLALPQRNDLPYGQMQSAIAQPEDYLGSRRLAVRHTAFDRQWDRVRHGSVSGSFARQAAAAGRADGSNDEALLQAVNAWTNRHVRYTEDSKLYGRADYWASAQATLERGAGDCEDIAIAKLALLGELGVPRSDIFLTIARDRARNADHALLVVKRGNRYWLLDNGTDRILDASSSYDYQPIMSFSGDRKWLHGFATTRVAANF